MKKVYLPVVLFTFCIVFHASVFAQAPADSRIGAPQADRVQVLLNSMEAGNTIHKGGFNMKGLYVNPAEDVEAKFGQSALRLGAEEAGGEASKGDFGVQGLVPGRTEALGMWVYLEADSNVGRVGMQVKDAEDESLMILTPADWTGWKWCEFDLDSADVAQTYPQPDKNLQVEYPLKNVHVVWFAEGAGPSSLVADMVTALTVLDEVPASPVRIELEVASRVADAPLEASLIAHNFSNEPVTVNLTFSLQKNPNLYSEPAPDPVYGRNHALGAPTWLVFNEEKLEDNSSTDGRTWTSSNAKIGKDQEPEVYHYIDLGQTREITKLVWRSGDANKAGLVDVAASVDGKTFERVEGLSRIDQKTKWGIQKFPEFKPFTARAIRFRNYSDSANQREFGLPSEIEIFDGIQDESGMFPQAGPVVTGGDATFTVPARSFASQALPLNVKVGPGSYLLAAGTEIEGVKTQIYQQIFGTLSQDPDLISTRSRIGINTSRLELVPFSEELGVGWVRFENMKWPFVSGAPHQYSYDGTVEPWQLDIDSILASYHKAGFGVVNYMFMTPEWATDPDKKVTEKMRYSQPPVDPAWYGEFCFQTAARYGSKKHPESDLLTADKKSGLGYVTHYEMWNEPNLNPKPNAGWGGWAASMDEYYEMMRYGAEAVKRADPDAVVTSAGYGGMTVDTVDALRTYTYDDGKHPVDFVDLINVHYYSGRKAPEISTSDGNAGTSGDMTFEENLKELAAWRDTHAPGRPIWLTETGYDSAGPFGTDETVQAARLPRVVMLSLAFGIDKVLIYREVGSNPSKHMASGVLRNNYTRKPSFYTFGTLIREFRDVVGGAVRLLHPDPNVWLMEWNNGGKPLLTVWTVNGTAELGMEFGACKGVDAFGSPTDLPSTADLEITQFPQYLKGVDANQETLVQLRSAYEERLSQARQRREKVEKLRKYLFDFGNSKNVGRHVLAGVSTPYVAVNEKVVLEDGKGYGFVQPGQLILDRAWMKDDPLGRDGIKLRGGVFKFSVEPGQYELAIRVEPFGDPQTVKIQGVDGQPSLRFSKDQPVAETAFSVTGAPTEVELLFTDDYTTLCWISCVESEDAK